MQDQVERPSVRGNRRAFIKGGGLAAGGAAIGLGLLATAVHCRSKFSALPSVEEMSAA